jgi:two-component system response regulator RegA
MTSTEESTLYQTDELPKDRTLLIVENDIYLLERLTRAMAERGFEVRGAPSVERAVALVHQRPPAFAIVDLRLADGNGLQVIEVLKRMRPNARVVMLSAYGSFPTVVSAIKLGAFDYLTKPADADEITDTLLTFPAGPVPPPEHPMSPERARRLHIEAIFEACGGNISATARQLNMHRRTLQRIRLRPIPAS